MYFLMRLFLRLERDWSIKMGDKMETFIENLKFNKDGLIPVIIQDAENGQVLMLAYMNKESLNRTLQTKKTYFWSRSRNKLWLKGETSGHYQFVKSIFIDCDKDTLLVKVEQVGVACHTGERSCFFRKLNEDRTYGIE